MRGVVQQSVIDLAKAVLGYEADKRMPICGYELAQRFLQFAMVSTSGFVGKRRLSMWFDCGCLIQDGCFVRIYPPKQGYSPLVAPYLRHPVGELGSIEWKMRIRYQRPVRQATFAELVQIGILDQFRFTLRTRDHYDGNRFRNISDGIVQQGRLRLIVFVLAQIPRVGEIDGDYGRTSFGEGSEQLRNILSFLASIFQHISRHGLRRKDCQTNVMRSWFTKLRSGIPLVQRRSGGVNAVALSKTEI